LEVAIANHLDARCILQPALLFDRLPKLPDRERERVKHAYWQALDEAISEQNTKRRLQSLAGHLDKEGFTPAARCLAEDLDALVVDLRYPVRHRRRWRSTNLMERSLGEVKRRPR
jgi:hypothetical protein